MKIKAWDLYVSSDDKWYILSRPLTEKELNDWVEKERMNWDDYLAVEVEVEKSEVDWKSAPHLEECEEDKN